MERHHPKMCPTSTVGTDFSFLSHFICCDGRDVCLQAESLVVLITGTHWETHMNWTVYIFFSLSNISQTRRGLLHCDPSWRVLFFHSSLFYYPSKMHNGLVAYQVDDATVLVPFTEWWPCLPQALCIILFLSQNIKHGHVTTSLKQYNLKHHSSFLLLKFLGFSCAGSLAVWTLLLMTRQH